IFDGRAVRNHVTSKPKFVSQSLGQPIMTAGDGNSIVIVIGTHHAEYSRFLDRGFKWRQEDILDFMQRGLWISARLSFTRAFGDAVNREVFRGRCDPKIFLHRLGHLDAEPRNQIWIFAVGVLDPSPTLVARNIERRSINVRI